MTSREYRKRYANENEELTIVSSSVAETMSKETLELLIMFKSDYRSYNLVRFSCSFYARTIVYNGNTVSLPAGRTYK